MADWASSMQQTYEYYTVDPGTWKDKTKLDIVKTCNISRDEETATLGSATIDITDAIGECYVRAYLVTIQNGLRERHPLGTFLVQTPKTGFNGKVKDVSIDAYTPLLELKENPPPIGYFILKGENIMDNVCRITQQHVRAPVIVTQSDRILFSDFIADSSDTWLTFVRDLAANAKHKPALDEMGRIFFAPEQDTASLQPVWTYTDDENSIMYPELTLKHDLYGIPNVVEVIYSNGKDYFYKKVINDDPNSPTSTVNRGREIIYRDTKPSLEGYSSEAQIQQYAEMLLKELSVVQYTITYTHAYCPVRLGDCVRINCEKLGLDGVKAKVISQNIKCEPGCPVSETAVFTVKLWG